MPTASGRETAAEKRARLARVKRAELDAEVAKLPEGWAASEATKLLLDDVALMESGAPSYKRAERTYATRAEASGVGRAVKAIVGGSPWYVEYVVQFEPFSGKPPVYKVEAPRD